MGLFSKKLKSEDIINGNSNLFLPYEKQQSLPRKFNIGDRVTAELSPSKYRDFAGRKITGKIVFLYPINGKDRNGKDTPAYMIMPDGFKIQSFIENEDSLYLAED